MQKKNHKFNKKFVWATSSRTLFEENTKGKKGITLIALIITIIVMLILVGVTVTVALNGGVFTTAKDSVKKQEEQEILETIIGATKYGTGEWKYIPNEEGQLNNRGYVTEITEIDLLETYNDIVQLYGNENVSEPIYTKFYEELDKFFEDRDLDLAKLLETLTMEQINEFMVAYAEENDYEFHNVKKPIEIEFSVKGQRGEYAYIMTTTNTIPKSILTAQEQEKRDIYNMMSQHVIMGNGEKIYTQSTCYYAYDTNEIDVEKTYKEIKDSLEEQNKELIIVYQKEERYIPTMINTERLVKVVIDVVGEYGTYAYLIATDNPADNPILEVEEMDIKATASCSADTNKTTIIAMKDYSKLNNLKTQEEVYKYIGQISGKFDTTDTKGVIECIYLQITGEIMTYEELEAGLIANGMIDSKDENKEKLIFDFLMENLYGGAIKTEKEYAEDLYSIYGQVDNFETEADACKYINNMSGETITNTKELLEMLYEKPYEEIEAEALTNEIIEENTENPESVILENFMRNNMKVTGIKTVEDFAIYMNVVSKKLTEEENEEETIKSLVINKEIVEADWSGTTATYTIEGENEAFDIRMYYNGKIGRTTASVTQE